MKTHLGIICLVNFTSSALSFAEENRGAEVLKRMSGCFKVTYTYVEDGTHDKQYPPSYEKAELTEENGVLIFQRTLFAQDMVVPHWREEWKLTDEDRNRWEQSVFGPKNELRYQCSGDLTFNQWRCLVPHALKPRRDIVDSKRPYSSIQRENILQITENRWIHVQINQKHLEDKTPYSNEVGWNEYVKVADEFCSSTKSEL
ncbi:MAG: hypothetical protein K2X39_00945 [Silvanigrellaceae bacterium]|nr:hypothetical protein [Silvanigrellaceae bacterium]